MLIIIVIIPVLLCLIINSQIVIYVRASSRCIHPHIPVTQIRTTNIKSEQSRISRRDIRLLCYMVMMFCMFVGGWTPIYISAIITNYIYVNLMVLQLLAMIAQICLLYNVINLFVYDHKLRGYLKFLILKCSRT